MGWMVFISFHIQIKKKNRKKYHEKEMMIFCQQKCFFVCSFSTSFEPLSIISRIVSVFFRLFMFRFVFSCYFVFIFIQFTFFVYACRKYMNYSKGTNYIAIRRRFKTVYLSGWLTFNFSWLIILSTSVWFFFHF